MKYKVTIKDVAKAAGVSATTVSYVLNNNENQTISEETKERVLSAAQELRYVPNYAARIMKNSESRCVGVVMNQSLDNYRYSSMMSGIVDELEKVNYRVLLCSTVNKKGQYSGYLEDYFRHQLDGIIYICSGNQGPSDEEKKSIIENQIPMVVWDSLEEDDAYDTLDIDYYSGAVEVTEAMITPEMKHFLYLKPYRKSRREEICLQAVYDVLERHPEIELRVLQEPKEVDWWRKKEQKEGASGIYNQSLYQLLEEQVGKFLDLKPEDGIVSSWAVWLSVVRDLIRKYGVTVKLGAFAEIKESGWKGHKLVFGKYHNYKNGKTCVKMLLDAIEHEDEKERNKIHQVSKMETVILKGD